MDNKLENRITVEDLMLLKQSFVKEGDDYDTLLSLNREQFCEALNVVFRKGNYDEYSDLFDHVDSNKEGYVDWDKFATAIMLQLYEREDKQKTSQIPQWKGLRTLLGQHRDIIQSVVFLRNISRYLIVSKEGTLSLWAQDLRFPRLQRVVNESCKSRDLWVTDMCLMASVNKVAMSFTSKEIKIYDVGNNLDLNPQYRISKLAAIPLCLGFQQSQRPTEAFLVWGDVDGMVNTVHFNSIHIGLFSRPSQTTGEKQDLCQDINVDEIEKNIYKSAKFFKHQAHAEWVRQVEFIADLECVVSCALTSNKSVCFGFLEYSSKTVRSGYVHVMQGVNGFDYNDRLNIIATAGVNHQICFWNPYVTSKPSGVLRGHMAPVLWVNFLETRSQLLSFSKDKVLRLWDVQLQVCLQKVSGIFPKGVDMHVHLYFHEEKNRLFAMFNSQIKLLEMKTDTRERVLTHDKAVVSVAFNSTLNQVMTASQDGSVTFWLLESGQKMKTFENLHQGQELMTLTLDALSELWYTGGTDATIRSWDMNGQCLNIMRCSALNAVDVSCVLPLKRSIVGAGWSRSFAIFHHEQLERALNVEAAEWKGGEQHEDDIVCAAFLPPSQLATASFDGEIVIWNLTSEMKSRSLKQRSRQAMQLNTTATMTARTNTFATQMTEKMSPSATGVNLSTKMNINVSGPLGNLDEASDCAFSVSKLLVLSVREAQPSESPLATGTLASCGGNGWVRFWDTNKSTIVAEFIAHERAPSIVMNVDNSVAVLVTADAEGHLKSWDISSYAVECCGDNLPINSAPELIAEWQAHQDLINAVEVINYEQGRYQLVMSASSDCSVVLSEIHGIVVGVFGQEDHWRIDIIDEVLQQDPESISERQLSHLSGSTKTITAGTGVVNLEVDSTVTEDNWRPRTPDPNNYRINVWNETSLGKEYQEKRTTRRQRKQPQTIPELRYLHWERLGKPPAGPFAALDTSDINEMEQLQKPDFCENPAKYFSDRDEKKRRDLELAAVNKSWKDELRNSFDEKNFLPRYILEFEHKMKLFHQKILTQEQQMQSDTTAKQQPVVTGGTGASGPSASGTQSSTRQSHSQVTFKEPSHGGVALSDASTVRSRRMMRAASKNS